VVLAFLNLFSLADINLCSDVRVPLGGGLTRTDKIALYRRKAANWPSSRQGCKSGQRELRDRAAVKGKIAPDIDVALVDR
jgi:hypothetical protein